MPLSFILTESHRTTAIGAQVIDEADTMFDQGFGPDIQRIVQPLKRLAPPVNVVLVSATMSKAVKRLIAETLSGVVPIQTTSFHRGVAGARRLQSCCSCRPCHSILLGF